MPETDRSPFSSDAMTLPLASSVSQGSVEVFGSSGALCVFHAMTGT
jgi:hypothetical protein